MIKVARMLQRRLANILTYLHLPLTNARSEGVNADPMAQYNARGYRNRENFRTAIYLLIMSGSTCPERRLVRMYELRLGSSVSICGQGDAVRD